MSNVRDWPGRLVPGTGIACLLWDLFSGQGTSLFFIRGIAEDVKTEKNGQYPDNFSHVKLPRSGNIQLPQVIQYTLLHNNYLSRVKEHWEQAFLGVTTSLLLNGRKAYTHELLITYMDPSIPIAVESVELVYKFCITILSLSLLTFEMLRLASWSRHMRGQIDQMWCQGVGHIRWWQLETLSWLYKHQTSTQMR